MALSAQDMPQDDVGMMLRIPDVKTLRGQILDGYDAEGVADYERWVEALTDADHRAMLADIGEHFSFSAGMEVLDSGAGSGALCLALAKLPNLNLTALDPSSAMLERLRARTNLAAVRVVQGFCDHVDDRDLFPSNSFDVIASKQLVNCLCDPIAAFRNWNHWLRPGGTLLITDGMFDRDGWTGRWSRFVDLLPLSACRSLATVPYLLTIAGFRIEHVGFMPATNALPSTRTKRYLVVAKRNAEPTEATA